MVTTSTLEDFLNLSNKLNNDICVLDGDMQMLVYENYSKFINAVEIIKKIKNNVMKIEEINVGSINYNISAVENNTNDLNNLLLKRSNKIEELVNVKKVLCALKVVFDLPSKMKNLLRGDEEAEENRGRREGKGEAEERKGRGVEEVGGEEEGGGRIGRDEEAGFAVNLCGARNVIELYNHTYSFIQREESRFGGLGGVREKCGKLYEIAVSRIWECLKEKNSKMFEEGEEGGEGRLDVEEGEKNKMEGGISLEGGMEMRCMSCEELYALCRLLLKTQKYSFNNLFDVYLNNIKYIISVNIKNIFYNNTKPSSSASPTLSSPSSLPTPPPTFSTSEQSINSPPENPLEIINKDVGERLIGVLVEAVRGGKGMMKCWEEMQGEREKENGNEENIFDKYNILFYKTIEIILKYIFKLLCHVCFTSSRPSYKQPSTPSTSFLPSSSSSSSIYNSSTLPPPSFSFPTSPAVIPICSTVESVGVLVCKMESIVKEMEEMRCVIFQLNLDLYRGIVKGKFRGLFEYIYSYLYYLYSSNGQNQINNNNNSNNNINSTLPTSPSTPPLPVGKSFSESDSAGHCNRLLLLICETTADLNYLVEYLRKAGNMRIRREEVGGRVGKNGGKSDGNIYVNEIIKEIYSCVDMCMDIYIYVGQMHLLHTHLISHKSILMLKPLIMHTPIYTQLHTPHTHTLYTLYRPHNHPPIHTHTPVHLHTHVLRFLL